MMMSQVMEVHKERGDCKGDCYGCREWVVWRFVCKQCLGWFCWRCKWPDSGFICRGCFEDGVFSDEAGDGKAQHPVQS